MIIFIFTQKEKDGPVNWEKDIKTHEHKGPYMYVWNTHTYRYRGIYINFPFYVQTLSKTSILTFLDFSAR